MFAVHMYEYYGTAEVVGKLFEKGSGAWFVHDCRREFGMDHHGKPVAAEAILQDLLRICKMGYLGWSWSGNGPWNGTSGSGDRF